MTKSMFLTENSINNVHGLFTGTRKSNLKNDLWMECFEARFKLYCAVFYGEKLMFHN